MGDGAPVDDGQVGTLFARGRNIMLGYWNDPEASHAVLRNGWLNTGDRAAKNPMGNYQICGRENGLVKIQGYRFHPNEIDAILVKLMPDIQLATVSYMDQGQTRLALFAHHPENGPNRPGGASENLSPTLGPTHGSPDFPGAQKLASQYSSEN